MQYFLDIGHVAVPLRGQKAHPNVAETATPRDPAYFAEASEAACIASIAAQMWTLDESPAARILKAFQHGGG